MENTNYAIESTIAFHKQRINSYKTYLELIDQKVNKAESQNDYNKVNEYADITQAAEERIKENEEIIRELTEKLQ